MKVRARLAIAIEDEVLEKYVIERSMWRKVRREANIGDEFFWSLLALQILLKKCRSENSSTVISRNAIIESRGKKGISAISSPSK